MCARHLPALLSSVGFFGSRLLAIALFLPVPSRALAGLPENIPADWLSAVRQDIAAQEYEVTWQDHTLLGAVPRGYQAPNRAQDFRTYFTPEGIRSIPRDTRQDEAPAWEWGLEWRALGRGALMEPVPEAVIGTSGNRVEYRRGEFLEWYINDPRGLEQGFTIQQAPSVSLGPGHAETARARANSPLPLRLEFEVCGNVHAAMTDGCDAVEFLAPGGTRAVHFGELRAADATGTGLPAWFEVQGGLMSIVVDDRCAAYPIAIDPLATNPNWTAESNQGGARFGHSVATAGDVNGDHYSDVIVGAPEYDNGQGDEGRAYVYHGSAAGLSLTANWTAECNHGGARFGHSVATAGDVNGDGYSDVIVGADGYGTDDGKAYVYYGFATGLSSTEGWTAVGHGGSSLGHSVATAGDVNWDGYSDVIVGAPNEGRAYVYRGQGGGSRPRRTGLRRAISSTPGSASAWPRRGTSTGTATAT